MTITIGNTLFATGSGGFAGTFTTNNNTMNCGMAAQFSSPSCTINLGSSTINCSTFDLSAGSITLNAGTSQLNFNGQFTTFGAPSGFTLYNVSWTYTGGSCTAHLGAGTYNNVTITAPTKEVALTLSGSPTINGTLTLTGASAALRIFVHYFNYTSTQRTITAATTSLTDVDFWNINGAGAAAWTGTRLGDCGNNSTITFTGAANKYWVTDAAADWKSTAWATSSGGTAGANNYPLPQDTAIFDASSFSAARTITLNDEASTGFTIMPNFDCSAVDQTFTLASVGSSRTIYWLGKTIKLATNFTYGTAPNFMYWIGTLFEVTTNGKTQPSNAWVPTYLNALPASRTLKLMDAWAHASAGSAFTWNGGTVDLNGQTMSVGTFASTSSGVRTIKSSVNGGVFKTLQTTGTVFNCAGATNLTIDRTTGTWTVQIGGNTATTRTFAGGSLTWPAFVFPNTTANGRVNFTGSNTFKSMSVSTPPQTFGFTAATTTTIEDENGFPSGTASNHVTITSISASEHTLAKSGGGVINSEDLTISWSTATPAATWYAGISSTDSGNNSGWTFGGTGVAASQGTLTATGVASVLSLNNFATPDARALVLASTASTASTSWLLTPTDGTVLITGHLPSLGNLYTPSTGSITFTGVVPQYALTVTPDVRALVLSGFAPAQGFSGFPTQGTLTTSGVASSLKTDYRYDPTTRALTLTGYVADNVSANQRAPATMALALVGGLPVIQIGAVTTVGGVSAVGRIRFVSVWTQVYDAQTPVWTEILT
jgi:hypothetical protein